MPIRGWPDVGLGKTWVLCLASQSPAQDTVNEAASFDPTKITAFKLHPCAMASARSGSLQLGPRLRPAPGPEPAP